MPETINKVTPIILCGGSGTRLWPLSRKAFPKQFLQVGGEESLFQRTLKRVANRDIYHPAVILTNADYRFQVAEQARQIDIELDAILLEPALRNTAAAIAAAAAYISQTDESGLAHILPSDHLINDDQAYYEAVQTAAQTASDGHLVTFGIEPTKPATGYGYIQAGEKLPSGAERVDQFVEKPALENALAMIAAGTYSWNSGMFLLGVDTFLGELEHFEPEIAKAARTAVAQASKDLDFVRLDEDAYAASPNISVDYAVFERTDKAVIVRASINWSDIGSWHSLHESYDADHDGNVVQGPATLLNADNNLVLSERQHVALNGVSNLAVVATADAVLVSSMDQSEEVKTLVAMLQQDEATAVLTSEHKTTLRPWGGYSSILSGDRFHVKRLFVSPGKKLSLQKHHHRAEHWVVVKGTAEVSVDDRVMMVSENESVYIPQGSVHRLSNPGKILLEVIEVQSGSYLGEDDIVRLEDDFGRG